MRYDAAIFDIDGTLWDASRTSVVGWNRGLMSLGIDYKITVNGLRSVSGYPYETCVDILLPGLRSTCPDLIRTLNDHEMEAIEAEGGEFYEGALEGVRELSKVLRIFLVSNCQRWYLEAFLGFSGIEDVLAGFDCHGSSGLSKDGMISRIKNGNHLRNAVYVGDTPGDEAAATLAGVEFIHVSWGFGKLRSDAKSVSSFQELEDYLRRA